MQESIQPGTPLLRPADVPSDVSPSHEADPQSGGSTAGNRLKLHVPDFAEFAEATEPPEVTGVLQPPAAREVPTAREAADAAGETFGRPSPEQAVSAEIVDSILKAAHRLRGLLTSHFSEFDLSDVRFSVLRILAESEPDGCTQADLAECLDQSESSISTLVKRMRKSELLYRLRSPFDKRKWVLKLNERGRGLLESVRCCHAERMCEILSGFDDREREELASLMRKLIDELTPRDRKDESDGGGSTTVRFEQNAVYGPHPLPGSATDAPAA